MQRAERAARREWRERRRTVWALALLAGCGTAAASGGFALSEVAPGVFVHPGHHAGLEDAARGDSANLGFIVGERCVAVIDTGGSLATGRALAAAIATRTATPVCYVVNTHAHFDHVLGNAAFAAEGVEFVGHAALGATLAASGDYFAERFAAELADAGGTVPVTPPDRLLEAHATLDLGGRRLELTAVAPAHTGADLTVLDVASGTLFTGDLVFMERLPVLDGSLRGWIEWLDAARKLPVTRIVPGHGPASAPWPAAAGPEADYLATLLAAARAAVAEGRFLEDVVAGAGAAPPAGWVLTEPHARNMSQAFREVEWE